MGRTRVGISSSFKKSVQVPTVYYLISHTTNKTFFCIYSSSFGLAQQLAEDGNADHDDEWGFENEMADGEGALIV